MRRFHIFTAAAIASCAPGFQADSQPLPAPDPLTYADLADLALAAPVAAHVEVRNSVRLKQAEAGGAAPGLTRFYVEADVISLIRGAQGLPARISYLVDLPADPGGKAPSIRRKSQFILLASTVAGRSGELQLVAPDAQIPFLPTRADRLRSILKEAADPGAPPRITGLGRAFHVRGSLPGESETQIFLQTADGRPVSLSVLRRPGETPRWAVALSEIVDDAAEPPVRESLGWYRLACTLPPALPAASLGDADPDSASAIKSDYRLIKQQLGPCTRSRAR
jgi:hypothetical protein